jgi:hypothetical protein
MDKTLQTMVGATDAIFCAAPTMVSDVATIVFFTQTMVFSNEKIFLPAGTIFLAAQKIV